MTNEDIDKQYWVVWLNMKKDKLTIFQPFILAQKRKYWDWIELHFLMYTMGIGME